MGFGRHRWYALAMRRLVIAIVLVLGACGPEGRPADETPQPPREREVLRERTSGFWTSNRPAENGAYRWRLLAIGGGLILVTGFFMLRAVRRANRSRPVQPGMRPLR
jgi:hypothetical protein